MILNNIISSSLIRQVHQLHQELILILV